jgi:hypothetical protein
VSRSRGPLNDFGIDERLFEGLEMSKRALIVGTNQTAVARDTRRQNSCQPPLYVLAAQDAPPKLGEIELWADVRLCPSPFRVKKPSSQP